MIRKPRSHALKPHRGTIPYIVLLGTLLLTAIATYYTHRTTKAKERLLFENAIQRTQTNIQDRLNTYIALLRAGRGLFDAAPEVGQAEFRQFANNLELRTQYPGIQGIGFSVRVAPSEKDALIEAMRQQGVTNFELSPGSLRDEYHTIIYLEPLDRRNQEAIGYDMFTEPVRRAAMERARDRGTVAASGRVTLVQEIDQKKQFGFLIYLPIYEGGATPNTIPERRDALRGFVYSPFRSGDFIQGVLRKQPNSLVDIQIYDGTETRPENLLYSPNLSQPSPKYTPQFRAVTRMEVGGRPWTLVFTSRPALEQASENQRVPLIAIAGTVISLILFVLTRSQTEAQIAVERSMVELRESEEALLAANRRVRTILESITDAFVAFDQQWHCIYVNQEAESLLQRSREELMGQTMWQVFPDLADSPFAAGLQQSIEQRSTLALEEFYPSLKSWLEVHIYPAPDGLSIYFRNIDERKQAEAERDLLLERERVARTEAEAANRTKDEFLAVLSHELRTPLNPILGWVRLLQTGQMNAQKTAEALEIIERNARLQTQLIEDLLDVSRILQGKLTLSKYSVDLVSILGAAQETIRLTAEAKNIAICTEVPSASRFILGDPNRLQQVIWNLLSNAVKFTPEGGQIEIRLAYGATEATLTIRDTGKGISPSFLPFVFDTFRQADGTITRQFGGLGLGLAIVRHLVHLHDGEVSADSAGEDQGATFTVTLPLIADPLPAKLPLQAASQAVDLRGVQVLVVDDDNDSQRFLAFLLTQANATVVTVGSAQAAIDIVKKSSIDVLVSDIGMPEMDGYALIQHIRAWESEQGHFPVPAIAVTAYASELDQQQAAAAGFQTHLAKPVEAEVLLRLIEQLVNSALPCP
ncbi:MAG TPA: CHASE domain-containing protein [Leptolyngbyaceae cyanobacterium]